jgi:hypothetical protein
MEMRLSLEQLKAMSDRELRDLWRSDSFPFDSASCGNCLTMHAYLRNVAIHACRVSSHQELTRQVVALAPPGADVPPMHGLREHLEELYALRLFFDSLYLEPQPAPESEQAVTVRG